MYDIASRASFEALPTFLGDARALAGEGCVCVVVGNKGDLAAGGSLAASANGGADEGGDIGTGTGAGSASASASASKRSSIGYGLGTQLTATTTLEGREVLPTDAARWASRSQIPVCVEVSAYTGEGVEEIFARLARVILTKIELGEVDPSDPASGVQYGDGGGAWEGGGGGKRGDGGMGEEGRRRGRRRRAGTWGMGEWEAVFRLEGRGRGRRAGGGCC